METSLARRRPRADADVPRAGLRRAGRRMADVLAAVVGPAEAASQRQDVLRRALVAPVIIAILPVQQLHIPGWQAVLIMCTAALIYNIPIAYLVFVRQQYFAARVVAFVADASLLAGGSFIVLHEMGAASSSSDLWLAFLVFVVSGGFTLAPAGSLIYTGLAMACFAAGTYLFYPEASHYREELPIRLIFFATFGLISLGMARELENRRARLATQNRQTMGMLARLVEARDTDAGAHLHHIQHFSRALALELGLSRRDADEIADAAMLHDVGKANVPDAILKKPGPLSPAERRAMQGHTIVGDRLLTENSEFEVARQVARWHHERWDGTGYPDRLAGSRIPFPARIVAVADVFDALISKRPYKDAWAPQHALAELRRLSGSHLDPEVVQAFVQLWNAGAIQRIIAQIDAETTQDERDFTRAA
jgi:HD-GYP domain-containing protein (c-di-GMP phosphodiesterase class II)